jgi:hypothetical protein
VAEAGHEMVPAQALAGAIAEVELQWSARFAAAFRLRQAHGGEHTLCVPTTGQAMHAADGSCLVGNGQLLHDILDNGNHDTIPYGLRLMALGRSAPLNCPDHKGEKIPRQCVEKRKMLLWKGNFAIQEGGKTNFRPKKNFPSETISSF